MELSSAASRIGRRASKPSVKRTWGMGDPGKSDPMQIDESGTSAAVTNGSSVRAQLDLQYVSIQLDGITFGGWYRLLSDGRMELIARAHMAWDRRSQATPREQAEAMLSELIRTERPLPPSSS